MPFVFTVIGAVTWNGEDFAGEVDAIEHCYWAEYRIQWSDQKSGNTSEWKNVKVEYVSYVNKFLLFFSSY